MLFSFNYFWKSVLAVGGSWSFSVTIESAFLLKIIDDKDTIKTIGPFAKEDDAFEALSTYLKSGVCSWVVSYNG